MMVGTSESEAKWLAPGGDAARDLRGFNPDSISRGSHCIERERRRPFARPKLSGVVSAADLLC